MTITAADPVSASTLFAGAVGVSTGTAGIGVATVVFVRDAIVDAQVGEAAWLRAAGGLGLVLTADQSQDVWMVAVAGGGAGTAGVAGAITTGVYDHETRAHLGRGVTLDGTSPDGEAGARLRATDHTVLRGIAGQAAAGGTAGVGLGADVQVMNKHTEASMAPQVLVTVPGDVTIDADSSEDVTSVSAGAAVGGTAGVSVNAAVPVYDVTTLAFIGEECGAAVASEASCAASRSVVLVGGSARITANEVLTMDLIAGSIAIGGAAGVGVGAAVPVLTKTTRAFIGDLSVVTALALTDGVLGTLGGFDISYIDTRFDPQFALDADGYTIDLGYAHGIDDGEVVTYFSGGGQALLGLGNGREFYALVDTSAPTKIRLSLTQGGAPIAVSVPARPGRSHRIVPLDEASVPAALQPYFIPGDVSGSTIALPYDLVAANGEVLIYTANGGTAIGGLVDGESYYVVGRAGNSLQLARTEGGPAISLDASQATGRAHSLTRQDTQPPGDPALATGIRVLSPRLGAIRGVAVIANNSDEILGDRRRWRGRRHGRRGRRRQRQRRERRHRRLHRPPRAGERHRERRGLSVPVRDCRRRAGRSVS